MKIANANRASPRNTTRNEVIISTIRHYKCAFAKNFLIEKVKSSNTIIFFCLLMTIMLTDDIATADAERDGLYSGYKKAVNGFKNLPVENMATAAKVLTQHIKDYAIDPKMQLDKETGLLINFIDDLEKKYSNEVQTLSLGAFVTALKAANEKVRTLTATRTDERMAKVVGALKASRKASNEAYRQLVKFVNAYALIEGDSKYLGFIDYVNTEIVHYKREVIGQKSGSAQPSGTTGGTTSSGSTTGGSSSGVSTGSMPMCRPCLLNK